MSNIAIAQDCAVNHPTPQHVLPTLDALIPLSSRARFFSNPELFGRECLRRGERLLPIGDWLSPRQPAVLVTEPQFYSRILLEERERLQSIPFNLQYTLLRKKLRLLEPEPFQEDLLGILAGKGVPAEFLQDIQAGAAAYLASFIDNCRSDELTKKRFFLDRSELIPEAWLSAGIGHLERGHRIFAIDLLLPLVEDLATGFLARVEGLPEGSPVQEYLKQELCNACLGLTSNALYILAASPGWQTRCRKEAKSGEETSPAGRTGDDRPELDQLMELVMRSHPVSPLLVRRGVEDLALDGANIAAGTLLVLVPALLGDNNRERPGNDQTRQIPGDERVSWSQLKDELFATDVTRWAVEEFAIPVSRLLLRETLLAAKIGLNSDYAPKRIHLPFSGFADRLPLLARWRV